MNEERETKDETFLEATIARMRVINLDVNKTNNGLQEILARFRGTVPPSVIDSEKDPKSVDCIRYQIDDALSNITSSLNLLHNQINELIEYI